MADQQSLRGGELNAAVTSALVGIHTEHLGRGPTTASTFHYRNVIVTLMYDVLSRAERALSRNEHADAIHAHGGCSSGRWRRTSPKRSSG